MKLELDNMESVNIKIGDIILIIQRYQDNLLITNQDFKQIEVNLDDMEVIK